MSLRRSDRGARLGRLARCARILACALLALALLDCATTPAGGVVHTVRPGENLYRIAHYYHVPVRKLVAANHVADVHEIPVGTRLWVPGSRRRPPAAALHPPLTDAAAARVAHKAALHARAGQPRFDWPLHGRITSRFGWRGRHMHEGLDIAARSGSPVRAARAGRVIFSGKLSGYGNVVIVQHDRRYASVYAHNRRNRVRKGAHVKRGQLLAEVGATGRATGPHLHFEIRRDEHPQDPLRFLR